MCEFCTKHGDGKTWFKNAANYASDLMADIERRKYIKGFFQSTIEDGIVTLGRLEVLYNKKKKLPQRVVTQMINRAKEEHFGQVVTIEDIREIVQKAATVVRLPCACRWAANKDENRCCYSVSYTPDAWYKDLDMTYFGLVPNMGLEKVTNDTAIHQMESLEEQGCIHTIWTMMTPFVGAICNCKPGGCLGLRTHALEVETMFRGEMLAVVDRQKCSGCGLCEETCQFNAVKSILSSGFYKAEVDTEKCFGCGLCRKCPEDAITMVTRLAE